MTSFVTDFLPIEVKPKAYYVQAKKAYFQHRLYAAKAGQHIYENEYSKLNNILLNQFLILSLS